MLGENIPPEVALVKNKKATQGGMTERLWKSGNYSVTRPDLIFDLEFVEVTFSTIPSLENRTCVIWISMFVLDWIRPTTGIKFCGDIFKEEKW